MVALSMESAKGVLRLIVSEIMVAAPPATMLRGVASIALKTGGSLVSE